MSKIIDALAQLPDFREDDGSLNLYALSEVNNWPSYNQQVYQDALSRPGIDVDVQEHITGILESTDDPDDLREPVDLENVELIELTDDYLVLSGGGDWQFPATIKIGVNDEGKLTVLDTQFFQDFQQGSEDLMDTLEAKLAEIA